MRNGYVAVPGFDYRPDREPGSDGGHAVEWTRLEWREFRERHEKSGGTVSRAKDIDGTHTTQFHNRLNGRPDLAMEAYGL